MFEHLTPTPFKKRKKEEKKEEKRRRRRKHPKKTIFVEGALYCFLVLHRIDEYIFLDQF